MYPEVPREYVEVLRPQVDKEIEEMSRIEIEAFLKGVVFGSTITTKTNEIGVDGVVRGLLASIEILQLRLFNTESDSTD